MKLQLNARQVNKPYLQYLELALIQQGGRGQNTIMFCYPDAPYHFEERGIPIIYEELTGFPQQIVEVIREKVYDYPILTVDEALLNYSAGRKFWEPYPHP